jgi:NADH dehydrogenase
MVKTPVEDVTAEGVTLGGRFVRAGTVIWGAGVRASPAGSWLGVDTDKAGRVKVGPDLTVPGHPEIFVLGDTALAMHDDGSPLPGLAQVAKQQGEHVGSHLPNHLARGEPMPPFRFKNRGNLATIGRNSAVADFGKRKIKGFVAWVLWGIVHVYLLIGFSNRLLVSMQWLFAYLTYHRGARLITGQRKAPIKENHERRSAAE